MADEKHEDGGDAAAEAFEELRAEVTLLRRAIERLAAERAEQPDFSETLGRILKGLNAALHRIDVLAKAAEHGVAPRYVADRIVAAGSAARAEDQRTIATACKGLEDATRALHSYIASARRGGEQNSWLAWSAIVGAVLGMVLWATFAGFVARAVPESWLWPERMAARALGTSMWEGGQRMIQASSSDRFEIPQPTSGASPETRR